jgi:hypothetical protein
LINDTRSVGDLVAGSGRQDTHVLVTGLVPLLHDLFDFEFLDARAEFQLEHIARIE